MIRPPKTIIVRSFKIGSPVFPEDFSETITRTIDVRSIIPPNAVRVGTTAVTEKNYQDIISWPNVKHFVDSETASLPCFLQQFMARTNEGFSRLEINYGCNDGLVLSRAIAFWAFDKIPQLYPSAAKVIKLVHAVKEIN